MDYIFKINEKGLEKIKDFLISNHVGFYQGEISDEVLKLWAHEAERNADKRGSYIGMIGLYSVNGEPQILEMHQDCFDAFKKKITLKSYPI